AMGRTPGKKVFDLAVVTVDGQPLSFARALGRTVAYAVSSLFFGLGFLWAAFDPQKQAWHDQLCGTLVVRQRPAEGRAVTACGRGHEEHHRQGCTGPAVSAGRGCRIPIP